MTAFKRATFYGDPSGNPFERPSMPLSNLALDGILGTGINNDSGESVDPLKGLAIPTAYRCINILATVVASCVVEEIDKGSGEANRWDILDGLLSYTQYEIMELVVAHLSGWGNFFGRKVMTGEKMTGSLQDLLPIFPGNVKVIKKDGEKVYRVRRVAASQDSPGQPNPAPGEAQDAGFDDFTDGPDCPIFHIPGFGFDGLQGVGPIVLAAQTVGTTIAADRLAARFYSNGSQLGGIIKVKVPLSKQSQADAIKMSWRAAHAGIRNAGDVAVLDSETDFEPITIAPNALQFLESRQWQAWEVAKMFGIPAYMIEPSSTWGSGIEQQNIGFVTFTVRAYTDRIEQRLTREFGRRGKLLEFDLDRLMRGSTMERFQAYGQAIGWGWMTRAEVRIKERLKSLDKKFGLDEPLTPQTMNGALQDGPMAAPGGNKPTGAQAASTPSQQQQQGPLQAKTGKRAEVREEFAELVELLGEYSIAQLQEFIGEGILTPDEEAYVAAHA